MNRRRHPAPLAPPVAGAWPRPAPRPERLGALAGAALLLSANLVHGSAAAGEQMSEEAGIPAPDVGVEVRQLSGARVVEAVLPGRVVDYSAPSSADRGGAVAVLLAPEEDPEGPRTAYRFDPAGEGSLEVLARGLPADADAIGRFTPHQEAHPMWIVGEPGTIYSLGQVDDPAVDRRPRVLLAAPGLDLAVLRRHDLLRSRQAFLPQPGLGRLEVFHANGNGALERSSLVDLPVRAERKGNHLRLSTPPIHLIQRPEAALPLIAVGPERQGGRRLLTTLVDPAATEEPEGARSEAWSRLNANERIAQSWYFTVDDQPILVVAALNADKLGIFEKKKLRVFPLRTDRTRAGTPPSLEILTATRNWYDVGVDVVDFDLDGRQDLLVSQPDGLGAKKLAVEVYRGKGNSGFFSTPRKSVIVAPDARWTFAADLSGDRVPDLVAIDSSQRLQIFSGLRDHKKKVLSKTPSRDLALQPADDNGISIHIHIDTEDRSDGDDRPNDLPWRGRPIIADFDGDGRGEILLRSEAGLRAILRVVALQ